MEDVLDLYAQPYDPAAPKVCFDEKPLVIHGEVREPLPVKPGYAQRSDYEYERLQAHSGHESPLFTVGQPVLPSEGLLNCRHFFAPHFFCQI